MGSFARIAEGVIQLTEDPGQSEERTRHQSAVALVVSADPLRYRPILEWLAGRSWLKTFAATEPTAALTCAERERPEIVVLDLECASSAGLGIGVEIQRVSPFTEIVYLAQTRSQPEAQAAKDLGYRQVVDVAAAIPWLESALYALVEYARAQRNLEVARQRKERLPVPPTESVTTELSLSAAERRYREAYIRECLARTGSRREAARRAGVPYTTFCVMLRKLGIAP